MGTNMDGLDKLTQRGRKVTPPRRPAPAVAPAPAEVADTTPPARVSPTPPARTPRSSRAQAPPATRADSAPLARGGATEQLGVRIHASQMRRLRRAVHLLDDTAQIHRPTQAELIQVLLESLPDGPGPRLDDLARRLRAYRARIVDSTKAV